MVTTVVANSQVQNKREIDFGFGVFTFYFNHLNFVDKGRVSSLIVAERSRGLLLH